MDIDQYIKADQVATHDPFDLRKHLGFYGLNFDTVDKAVLPFIGKLILSQSWLRVGIWESLPNDDCRRSVLGAASGHTERCSKLIARELKDPDRLRFVSVTSSVHSPVGDVPEAWLNLGLSALVLELVMNHIRSLSRNSDAHEQFHGLMRAMGQGFGLERAFALSEAGRQATGKDDPRLKKAIAEFVPPAEVAGGEHFINEAIATLRGRVGSRSDVLHAAVKALDAAQGLPRNKWLYAEPHLLRHGPSFGIGKMKRLAIRAVLAVL